MTKILFKKIYGKDSQGLFNCEIHSIVEEKIGQKLQYGRSTEKTF